MSFNLHDNERDIIPEALMACEKLYLLDDMTDQLLRLHVMILSKKFFETILTKEFVIFI